MNKMAEVLKNPYSVLRFFNHRGMLEWVPDRSFVKLMYRAYIGKPLDLKHPKTYNEKLQWIKLYDRKPEYTRKADKYAVREYIKQSIGEEYLVPLIGAYKTPEEIDWKALPERFVLKCNHGSGTNIICRDKSRLDIEKTVAQLKKWLGRNAYYFGREWCYKDISPMIICEAYIQTENGRPPIDYKFMCFNGAPHLIQVHQNRGLKDYSLSYYTPAWEKTELKRIDAPSTENIVPRPEKLDEMLKIAAFLSKGTYYCRIDLYYEQGKIYFGEITYYPTSGFSTFSDDETDLALGGLIQLPTDLRKE